MHTEPDAEVPWGLNCESMGTSNMQFKCADLGDLGRFHEEGVHIRFKHNFRKGRRALGEFQGWRCPVWKSLCASFTGCRESKMQQALTTASGSPTRMDVSSEDGLVASACHFCVLYLQKTCHKDDYLWMSGVAWISKLFIFSVGVHSGHWGAISS